MNLCLEIHRQKAPLYFWSNTLQQDRFLRKRQDHLRGSDHLSNLRDLGPGHLSCQDHPWGHHVDLCLVLPGGRPQEVAQPPHVRQPTLVAAAHGRLFGHLVDLLTTFLPEPARLEECLLWGAGQDPRGFPLGAWATCAAPGRGPGLHWGATVAPSLPAGPAACLR